MEDILKEILRRLDKMEYGTITFVDAVTLPANVIHLKGFASGMDHVKNPPSDRMILKLSRTGAIVFDGDGYSESLYTFAIKLAVDRAIRDRRNPPSVIAFRYKTELEDFVKSWKPTGITIQCFLVKDRDVRQYLMCEKPNFANFKRLPPNPDQMKYVALGLFAVATTASSTHRKVFVWGGWETVLYEFLYGQLLFKQNAPHWFYYDAVRTVQQRGILGQFLADFKYSNLTKASTDRQAVLG